MSAPGARLDRHSGSVGGIRQKSCFLCRVSLPSAAGPKAKPATKCATDLVNQYLNLMRKCNTKPETKATFSASYNTYNTEDPIRIRLHGTRQASDSWTYCAGLESIARRASFIKAC
jgi:hypothetical protein